MLFVKACSSRKFYKLIIEYKINGGTRISDGGGDHPDPEITGGQSQKSFVWPFRPRFGLKERGGIQVPRAPPLGPQLKME